MKTIFLIIIGISIINAEFIRDDLRNIVKDTRTNMEWQDDSLSYTGSYKDGIGYCESLNLDGGGWKLPNINQLKSIVDFNSYTPAISGEFTQTFNDYYWSSTTNASDTYMAWAVHFYNGSQYPDNKTYNHYIRCVRTGR